MTDVSPIEQAFVALAAGVDGIKSALDHEPGREGLPRLPCVTMLYVGARRVAEYTGSVDDLEHNWDVYVYVRLKHFKDAQNDLRELVNRLLDAARPVVLNGSEMSHLDDDLARPEFFPPDNVAMKRLRLRARMSGF